MAIDLCDAPNETTDATETAPAPIGEAPVEKYAYGGLATGAVGG